MSNWECGVCGYIHKEGEPPEKCPICEAPEKMFVECSVEGETEEEKSTVKTVEPAAEKKETEPETDPHKVRKWRCTVSGYVHLGTEPPEQCPICEATAEQFEEVVEDEDSTPPLEPVTKKWRCTVCGYIHNGETPPEKCPVCAAPASMFVEIDLEGKALGEVEKEEPVSLEKTEENVEQESSSFMEKIGRLILALHLHPITVHFPNGIIPVAVVFLALAIYTKIELLESVAFYNFIAVLIMLPIVIFTGYIEWQKRYKGVRTAIFITKIISAVIVLGAVNVLVIWRLLDPEVVAAGSPTQLIYLGIAGAALGAAAIAGHLGGKLVFGTRG